MKKKILIAVGILLLIALVAGIYGYREFHRTHADATHTKADVTLQADALVKAFSDNETQADSMYLDKIISVSGTVIGMETDSQGIYTIMLDGKNDMSNVSCQMDERHNNDAASIKKGDAVTMKGTCTGILMDVVLNRCVIEKNKK